MKIGVIGVGVVGGALLRVVASKGYEVHGFDKFKADFQRPQNWENVLSCDIAFVCVPTLTFDRVQDLTPVQDVFWMLEEAGFKGVVCLRCTVLPGTTDRLQKKHPNLKIVHQPEFLKEASPEQDLLNQMTVVVGSNDDDSGMKVISFWKDFDPSLNVVWRKPVETEMAKYVHNCFLAIKVSAFNEFFDICKKIGCDYNRAVSAAQSIGNIGLSHTMVPGPDGKFGFGGMCFPKDTDALSFFFEMHATPAETLNGAILGNNRRRPR